MTAYQRGNQSLEAETLDPHLPKAALDRITTFLIENESHGGVSVAEDFGRISSESEVATIGKFRYWLGDS